MDKRTINVGDTFKVRAAGLITPVVVTAVVRYRYGAEQGHKTVTRYEVTRCGVTEIGNSFGVESRPLPGHRRASALHPLNWTGGTVPEALRANRFVAPDPAEG